MKMFVLSAEFFKRFVSAIILMFCLFGAYFHSAMLFNCFMGVIWFLIIILEWHRLIKTSFFKYLGITLLYPTLPILSLILLDYSFAQSNLLIPLYPFVAAWTADTFAYLVGKSIGSHKMSPILSPGKTWEGFFGGMVGVFVLNLWYMPRVDIDMFTHPNAFWDIYMMLVFAAIITTVAFFGGLFISSLKRKQGLKDAGIILPGHGGLLDRFDSVFFVAPFWLIVCLIFVSEY